VTILFTDIEGSTAMFQRLGDDRAMDVLRGHEALVRREVTAHGGVVVKSQGDGFMVAFRSARRALDCAVGLQRALRDYAGNHRDTGVRVRVGIHAGEALRDSDDFYGKAVIVAARIADKAAGGEILVSSLIRELTESSGRSRSSTTGGWN
jgi:class 3 adenylate cyclase